MAFANANFDEFVATTLKNYQPTMADNITNHAVFFKWLREHKKFRTEPGGTSIVEPLMHEQNNTVKSYSKYETFDTTPQEGISAAEYNWKQVAGSITIDGFSEFQNQPSKTRVLNLLQAKVTQLEISFRETLNAMLITGDGTGNGGKDITGLALAIEEGSVWSTYGGIDRIANPFWRNRWLQWAATFGSGPTSDGIQKMRNMYNLCTRGNDRPQLILTTLALFEEYENALATGERFAMGGSAVKGDAGFLGLSFKNTPMMFDEDVQVGAGVTPSDGFMYFLNFTYLNFVVGKGRDFMPTPFVRPHNQEARTSQVIFYGQLTSNNNQRLGVITTHA